jgi:hypothetical protein
LLIIFVVLTVIIANYKSVLEEVQRILALAALAEEEKSSREWQLPKKDQVISWTTAADESSPLSRSLWRSLLLVGRTIGMYPIP